MTTRASRAMLRSYHRRKARSARSLVLRPRNSRFRLSHTNLAGEWDDEFIYEILKSEWDAPDAEPAHPCS